ncbi:hypothetical protein U9M48_004455 [Paspalum notatum var. saurae]|uniref:Histone deacetylase n=1 Tax=Paspalum notatum var. saurae TaxID=547442 RepID=A0AAQ3PV53_PASNO
MARNETSPAPPPPPFADGDTRNRRKRVCYYYDPRISYMDYGENHVMVPHRASMTHGLVQAYGLLADMDLLRVAPATEADLKLAHDDRYLAVLRTITPDTYKNDADARKQAQLCKLGAVCGAGCWTEDNDNPVIDDLWDHCRRYAGGSLAAARALATGAYDVAINWSGGMHHARDGAAHGFCYVNDIVVAIKTLLGGGFARVLYVDIDAHHGDGVQEKFLRERRVMTVSFHQYDVATKFFPGTGAAEDCGGEQAGAAKYRALNVPLEAGTGDERYHEMFGPIVERVMGVFRPDAVVLQCGADSLAGDRIAGLRLTVRGHARCVRLLRGYGLPLLLLGGGGYTINHVASCWCYETAVAIGKEIPDDIPQHWYQHYYKSQDYKLHYCLEAAAGRRKRSTTTTTEHMTKTKKTVMDHLKHLSEDMTSRPDDDGEPPLPPRALHINDVDALVDRSSKRSQDPMERLHRRCGEEDLDEFFVYLGKKLHKRNSS